MARHVSGVFFKTDRAPVAPGTTVRLFGADHKPLGRATLIELGTSALRLSAPRPLQLGTKVLVAITLPGRYIEFEVPGMVDWELDCHFGVSFEYLTARQAYALALARDLLSTAPSEVAAAPRRAARR
ncbi:MAG: hypothetical protein EOO73_10435 [Myxococcales bacterium]|nr:MAG: hypothetical protein EOO73_10435 [Myxococcales bacterium]